MSLVLFWGQNERKVVHLDHFFCFLSYKSNYSVLRGQNLYKGNARVISLLYVDKMLNAFTMHSFFTTMPSKNVITMPFGTGAFLISTQKTYLIHLFINQFNSL